MRDLGRRVEPFFSEQDRGEGRHLLVGVVLQASQVEVEISKKETGNNADPIRESQTGSGSESETGVGYWIRESGQTGQTNSGILTAERRTSSMQLTEQYNVI
jgi:hypothetical protein